MPEKGLFWVWERPLTAPHRVNTDWFLKQSTVNGASRSRPSQRDRAADSRSAPEARW